MSGGKDGRRKEEEEGREQKEGEGMGKGKRWERGRKTEKFYVKQEDSKQPTTAILCSCFKQWVNGHAHTYCK